MERAEALRRLSGRIFEAPSLGLGWKRVEDRSTEASGPVVSAGWTVPLFDRRQADRQEAEARLSIARADLELARVRAQAERAGALAAFDLLRTEAAEADRAAAETVDLLTGASASYQLGESGLTDLLDTLRAALAARITALEIREAALDAQRDLEAATPSAAARCWAPARSKGDPQRRAAGVSLSAPDEGGGAAARPGGGPGLARAAGAGADDGLDGRARADPLGAGGRRAGQRDPEPDGAVVFLHYWGTGPAARLAQVLRSALEAQAATGRR